MNKYRFNPYSRASHPSGGSNLVINAEYELETGLGLLPPKPNNVMILRKSDPVNPSHLDAPVTWSNKFEISIGRFKLPDETLFGKQGEEDSSKVQLFIQLNPNVRELKSFLANVRIEESEKIKERYIGPIVISLKTDLAESQEEKLLAMTTMEERTAAFNLVNNKELSQLTTGNCYFIFQLDGS